YVTLAIPTGLSLVQPGQTASEQIETVLLVALAAAWIVFIYTRAPVPRAMDTSTPNSHKVYRIRMAVYFVGLLLFASLLMARQPIFFVFASTGFFHASLLRPWALAMLGIAATSIL